MKDLHEPCHLSLIDSNYDTNKISCFKKNPYYWNINSPLYSLSKYEWEKSKPSDTSYNEMT